MRPCRPHLLVSMLALLALAGIPGVPAQETQTDPPVPVEAVESYNAGLELAQSGKFSEARTKFEEALATAPAFGAARYNLGLVLRQLGDKQGAVKELLASLADAPQPAAAHRILGELLAELDRAADAMTHYEKALALDAEMSDLYYVMADLLQRTAKTEDETSAAVAAYERALEKVPRNPSALRAYKILGKAYYRGGQREKALTMYDRAARLDPKDAELQYNRGVLSNQLDKTEQAIEALEKAIELKNPNGKAFFALAEIYYNTLHLDEKAARAYESAAADPEFNKLDLANERALMIREYLEKKAQAEKTAEDGAGSDGGD